MEWIPTNIKLPGIKKDSTQWNGRGGKSDKILFCVDGEVYYGNFVVGLNTGFYDWSLCTKEDPYGGYFWTTEVSSWAEIK